MQTPRRSPSPAADAEALVGAGEERTTPLELFFDLVFVYAVTQVAHLVNAHPTPEGFARGAVVLATVWYAWICFAWLTNNVRVDDGVIRRGVLAAAGASFLVALAVPHALDSEALLFVSAYFVVRLLHVALFAYGTRDAPEIRRKVVRANDAPRSGDIFGSLYLLFSAIREQSTVALSGESADEVFGGYLWFHDEAVRSRSMFPWISYLASRRGNGAVSVLNRKLLRKLDLGGHLRERYAEAVGEIERLEGESDDEWAMRKVCYLHLTRMVRILLDRKDRMSMAVGLEVRVPFCDHRLVEYVYNTPWSLKTFDGREKSLLRAATQDVLPQSVVERRKSPYPQTQDPAYVETLAGQVRELLADRHPVFELVDRNAVEPLTRSADGTARRHLEQTLSLATWMDLYQPDLRLN